MRDLSLQLGGMTGCEGAAIKKAESESTNSRRSCSGKKAKHACISARALDRGVA